MTFSVSPNNAHNSIMSIIVFCACAGQSCSQYSTIVNYQYQYQYLKTVLKYKYQ